MERHALTTSMRRTLLVGSMAAVMAIGLGAGAVDAKTSKTTKIQPPPLDFQLCTLATNRYMDLIWEAGQNPGTVTDAELDAREAVMNDLCYTPPAYLMEE
jgi:hypothetical protein